MMMIRPSRTAPLLRAASVAMVVLVVSASSAARHVDGDRAEKRSDALGASGDRAGSTLLVQGGVGVGVEQGGNAGELPNPGGCSRCYETFQTQTRQCRGMDNEVDRDVCLDAVRDAYKQCSKGC